jgi:hypothetical protein
VANRLHDRLSPADATGDYGCVWYELTPERIAQRPPRTRHLHLRLAAVAQWGAIWRLCETAIEERLSAGDTLAGIAEAGGLTTKGLRQIRQGLVWPDSLTAIRLTTALGVELAVEPVT